MLNNSPVLSIKTDIFEGPLELLIDLVERRKLLINDISLAAVTDEYMKRVSDMQERSLPNTAHFVALAATLLLIKSKSLLPILELTSEEEANIDNLEERLRYYQLFREAGRTLGTSFGAITLYGAEYSPPRTPLFLPDEYCTNTALRHAMEQVINNLPKKSFQPTVHVKPTITLEQMIDRFKDEIERRVRTSFARLSTTHDSERKTVIVGFLAILELFKQGSVRMDQPDHFSDIEIEHLGQGAPRYY